MNNRFIRVNGQEFSFDEVAKALGVSLPESQQDHTVQLCQRVNAGVLVAGGAWGEPDPYPCIDVELHLAEEQNSDPILITKTEQPVQEDSPEALRTYCYSRYNEYFMYFDTDTRPDKYVDKETLLPSVAVSGGPYYNVEVTAEDPYVSFNSYCAARHRREPPMLADAQQLAADIDRFTKTHDTYEYRDRVDDPEEHVQEIYAILLAGKTDSLVDYFWDILDESEEPEAIIEAKNLLRRIEPFSYYQYELPLRRATLAQQISSAEVRKADGPATPEASPER